MSKDFIILEGCDGVGKTTIVNKLKDLGYKSLHFDFDPTLSIKQKYERILGASYDTPIVLDRSFISEMVYGPINRGGSRLSESDFQDLLSLINKRGGVLFICRRHRKRYISEYFYAVTKTRKS